VKEANEWWRFHLYQARIEFRKTVNKARDYMANASRWQAPNDGLMPPLIEPWPTVVAIEERTPNPTLIHCSTGGRSRKPGTKIDEASTYRYLKNPSAHFLGEPSG